MLDGERDLLAQLAACDLAFEHDLVLLLVNAELFGSFFDANAVALAEIEIDAYAKCAGSQRRSLWDVAATLAFDDVRRR